MNGTLLRVNCSVAQLSGPSGHWMPIAAPRNSALWTMSSPISAMTMVAMAK